MSAGFVVALLILFLYATVGPLAHSQIAGDVSASELRLNAPAVKHSTDEAVAVLDRPVTINMEQASLEDVLWEVAGQALIGLSYNSELLSGADAVTMRVEREKVGDVLETLLRPRNLEAYLTPNEELIITKAEEMETELLQTGVEGRVVDSESGEPLPGATVLVEETGAGDATDVEGSFRIEGVQPGSYTLVVSFVGYETHSESIEVVEGEMVSLEVALMSEELGLDELVVTGYAVTPRRQVTGAISTVRGEDFRVRPIETADRALQGTSAGVMVSGTSGEPGGGSYIRIRGIGSISAGNTPLIVVDGIPLDDQYDSNLVSSNILGSINPRDIESIEVLRDADATAIYGAQGANGVILVTTRSGAEGPTQFSASYQRGYQEQWNRYDMLDGPEWVEYMAEAYANRAETLGNSRESGIQQAYDHFGHPNEVQSYDWQDALLQTGLRNEVNLSATGGNEETRFYLSGSYINQEGSVRGTGMDRYTLRTNIDHQANERLSLETRINFSARDQDATLPGGSNSIRSPFHGGVSIRPTTPIYDENDPTGFNQDIVGIGYNLVQLIDAEVYTNRTHQLQGGLAAIYRLTDNLSIRPSYNIEARWLRDHRHRHPSVPQFGDFGGEAYARSSETLNWQTNVVLNFNDTYGDVHNVSALAGAEYRSMQSRVHQATGRGFPHPSHQVLNMAAVMQNIGGVNTGYRTAGFFSRVQYNYDNRYYANASLRTDGHSRFGAEQRWGVFYSVGLSWDVSQESFMEDVHWVTQLQPRFSYGITGNSNIGNFASLELYGPGGTYDGQGGMRPSQLGNNLLTWEEAHTMDFGIDWSLLGGRLYGMSGVYRNHNQELLLDRFLPADSGFDEITENVGTVRNEGIEIELGAVPLDIGMFRWNSEFNITFQRSEITELHEGQELVSNTVRLGYPRHVWWGREEAGVNPADGRMLLYDADGNYTLSASDDDLRVLGSYIPDYYGGFRNAFSVGPVTLDTFFQFEVGADIQNTTYHAFLRAPWRERALVREVLERWQEPGDVTHIPMAYPNNAIRGAQNWTSGMSALRLQNGSYVRLKSMQLSYQVPARFLEPIQLMNASLFIQGENLYTWTAFSGIDPERPQTHQADYPMPMTVTAGINIDF